MNILFGIAAVATPLLVSQYLGNGGFVAFPLAALLLLAGALRARRRTRAQAHASGDAGVDARAVDAGRRIPAWVWMCVLALAGLGAAVWALGLWVLWTTGAVGLLVIFVRFRPGRSATPSLPSINPVSSPVDSGSWLSELPGRAADAVDAARLIRGHADAAGVQTPDAGEEA